MKIAVVLNKSISETKIVLEQIVTKFEKSGLDYEILDIDKLKTGYNFVMGQCLKLLDFSRKRALL